MYMKNPESAEQKKKHVSDFSYFYFLSYGWLYLQITVTNLDFQVYSRQKKRSKIVKFTGRMRNELKQMQN